MPNLLLRSQQILACFCSVLSTEKWRVRRAARPRMQPAKAPDALIQDGPLRASMDPQLLRAKAGFTDTVSVGLARDIYTICLHTTQRSPVFFSVVVTLNICHLVGALITVKPVDTFLEKGLSQRESNPPPCIRALIYALSNRVQLFSNLLHT